MYLLPAENLKEQFACSSRAVFPREKGKGSGHEMIWISFVTSPIWTVKMEEIAQN